MKCPYCNNTDTRVIDSRSAEDGNSIRRRRCCDECGKRFTTYEKVETIPLIVIKKDDIASSMTVRRLRVVFLEHAIRDRFLRSRFREH